jgi:hypothetical protein
MSMLEVKSREVFAVMGNRDLTEGRGGNFVKSYCEVYATAVRLGNKGYIQGSNCPIETRPLYKIEEFGRWLGPVEIFPPSQADTKHQLTLDKYKSAMAAAVSAGLTQEQIKLIQEMSV